MNTAKLSNYITFNKQQPENYIKDVDRDLVNLFIALKGNISFGDGTDGDIENASGIFQVVSDTGNADTEFTVAHGLGVAPIGFLTTNIDKGGVIYDSGTAWDSTNIYLKCSVANAAVTLFLLK